MPDRIRFEHRVLDGRFHVITSPDLKGLHVTADTRESAEREALTVLAALRAKLDAKSVLAAVEYSPA